MLDSPPRLLVATTNTGKLREITHLLDGTPIRLLTLNDVASGGDPEETGTTFAENALLKAQYYCGESGLLTVAEDSGLSIDALNGRPGVTSARYPGASYADKFANLYEELKPYPRPWTARFVCALALVKPQSIGRRTGAGRRAPNPGHGTCRLLFSCEATVEGEIADGPRGANGFGYDPIFFYPPYARTLGETDDDEKLAVAHRGRAFRQLREWLENNGSQLI